MSTLNTNIGRISELYDLVVNQVDERLVNLVLDNIDYFVENLNSNVTDIIVNRSDIDSIFNVIDSLREQIRNNILSSNLSSEEQRLNALQLLQSYLNDDIVTIVDEDRDDVREKFYELSNIIREYVIDRRSDVKINVRGVLEPILNRWYNAARRYIRVIDLVYDDILDFIEELHDDADGMISYDEDYISMLSEYMNDYSDRLGERLLDLYQNNSVALGQVAVSDSNNPVVRLYDNRLSSELLSLYEQLLNYGDIEDLFKTRVGLDSHDTLIERLDDLLTQ